MNKKLSAPRTFSNNPSLGLNMCVLLDSGHIDSVFSWLGSHFPQAAVFHFVVCPPHAGGVLSDSFIMSVIKVV